MIDIDEWKKIGIGLTLFGVIFIFTGVLFLFDKGLIAMGNLMFIAGIALVIGVYKTMRFFFDRSKWKGTACFLGGFCLVLMGWPIIGMTIEFFGFVNLFGDFFPTVLFFARRIPVLSSLLDMPFVRMITDRISSHVTTERRLPV